MVANVSPHREDASERDAQKWDPQKYALELWHEDPQRTHSTTSWIALAVAAGTHGTCVQPLGGLGM
eukprot:2331634-Amphidinium_carterae.2